MALFMLVWALLMARTLIALVTGDLAGLSRLAGAQSLDEEVREELDQVAVHDSRADR